MMRARFRKRAARRLRVWSRDLHVPDAKAVAKVLPPAKLEARRKSRAAGIAADKDAEIEVPILPKMADHGNLEVRTVVPGGRRREPRARGGVLNDLGAV